MATMKNQAVSYNMDDPKQRAMYEWVLKRGPYSTVIKELIWEAMQKEKARKGAGIRINLTNELKGSRRPE